MSLTFNTSATSAWSRHRRVSVDDLPGRKIFPQLFELWTSEASPSPDKLRQVLGEEKFRQLKSLERESNPELLLSGLLLFGLRLEEEQKPELAAQLYHCVQTASAHPCFSAFSDLQSEAQARLKALSGEGSFGRVFEIFARNLPRESLQPGPLLAFAAASAAFRVGRLAYLSRISSSGLSPWITQGWELKAGATFAGFLSETTAFVATQRGLGKVFSPEAPERNLGQDWLGAALSLGALKAFGSATQAAAERWAAGSGWMERATRALLPQAGMFSGLVLGGQLERIAELRPATPPGKALEESLFSFLHLQIGSALCRELMGPRFSAWEAKWQRYTDVLSEKNGPPTFPGFEIFQTAGAPFSVVSLEASEAKLDSPSLAFFRKRSGDGGGNPRPLPNKKELHRLFVSLKTLGTRGRSLVPQDQVAFSTQLALDFNQAGLRERAIQSIQRAQEIAVGIKDHQAGTRCFLGIAEALSALGHRSEALANFEEAELHIQKLPLHEQIPALAKLGALRADNYDEASKGDFLQAAILIEEMPAGEREKLKQDLAQKITEAGHLPQARKLLDENKPFNRVFALATLGKKWAQLAALDENYSFLTFATTSFQEVRATLQRELKANAPMDALAVAHEALVRAMSSSGPDFREEARDELRAYQNFLSEQAKRLQYLDQYSEQLPLLMAKVGDWKAALELIRNQRRTHHFMRSPSVKNLVINMAQNGESKSALGVLRKEKLTPANRFEALLGIARHMPRKSAEESKAVLRILREAKKLILQSEFHAGALNRPAGLLLLARELAGFPQEREAIRELLEDAYRSMKQESQNHLARIQFNAEVALATFRDLDLPLLQKEGDHWWRGLNEAAQHKKWQELAWLGTILGVRGMDWEELSDRIVQVPEAGRTLAKSWILYGMTLIPREEQQEKEIGDHIRDMMTSLYHVPNPLGGPSQLLLIQAMRRILPNTLERTLIEETHTRLEKSQTLVRAGTLQWWGRLEFDPEDEVFYHGLSYLARHGSIPSKAFVGEIVSAPQFPEAWRRSLDRAFLQHGYRRITPKRELN